MKTSCKSVSGYTFGSLKRFSIHMLVPLVLLLGGTAQAQTGPILPQSGAFDIEDLGSLASDTIARGINASGQVAGFSMNGAACCAQAFVFTPPGPSQYVPFSYFITYGQAINDAGVLAGDQNIAGGAGGYQAFRYSGNTLQPVDLLTGYPYAQGIAINNTDEVAGDAYSRTARRAFLNTQSGTVGLGTLGGNSYARGLNDSTEVVGYFEDSGTISYWRPGLAFYWKRNLGMKNLNHVTSNLGTPNVNHFELNKASAINNHHQIVGFAGSTDLNVVRAFFLDRTSVNPLQYRFTDLGTLPNGGISYALALNRGGATVGAAYWDPTGVGNIRAALFTHGRVVNLNDRLQLIDDGLHWLLAEATGINDNGEIVGWGFHDTNPNQIRAFKLTPRARISVVGEVVPANLGKYLLALDGTGFTPGAQIWLEVRVGDIGGRLVKSARKAAASNGTLAWGAKPVPCNVDLAVSAWDSATSVYSNAGTVNIGCQ